MISKSSDPGNFFNHAEALKHLAALGYNSNDTIFFRYINPKTQQCHASAYALEVL